MGIKDSLNDEDIGIRSFHLEREKAVERALEKVRQKLGGSNWQKLSKKDTTALRWSLGEVWSLSGRTEWGELSFSTLTPSLVQKIIRIAQQITNHKKSGSQGFEEIQTIIKDSKQQPSSSQ